MASALAQGKAFQAQRSDGPFPDGAGANVGLRASKWGELVNLPFNAKMAGPADEGSYFVVTNPTPGTGVIGPASAVAADAASGLKADFYIENTAVAGSNPDNKRIYLDYLKLTVVTAGAGSSDLHYTTHTDTIAGGSRYSSGGGAVTPVNVYQPGSSTIAANLYFGALVVGANQSQRIIGNGLMRNHIEVAKDIYLFDFGGENKFGSSIDLAGTTTPIVPIPHVPVIIGPKSCFFLLGWAASKTTGTTWEFECGFWWR